MDQATNAGPPSRCHIAPAGYGKTHRIVKELAGRTGLRSLVLTHTNAGVGVIRARLKQNGVASSKAFVSTIDGWCLRLVKAYPYTAGIGITATVMPSWQEIRTGASRILARRFAGEVVRSSYGMIYVDEYQDCSLEQHAVVKALAAMVETHVFGDPLQGIFAFQGEEAQVVSWTEHIRPVFPVETNETWMPQRWAASPDLGRFVERLRREIIAGGQVDLRAPGVTLVPTEPIGQVSLLKRAIQQDGRTLVIRSLHPRCHHLAKMVGKPYRCIEPVECPELLRFERDVAGAVGIDLPSVLLGLLVKCCKDIKPNDARILNYLAKAQGGRKRLAHVGIRSIVESCERLMRDRTMGAMVEVMSHFADRHAYRPDPIRILNDAAKMDGGALSGLSAAITKVHERDRHLARRMPWRCIGTTKLVKGLEAHNVIAMDVESMDAADLYVTLTRATHHLTIVTSTQVLPAPRRPLRVKQAIEAGILVGT